MSLSRRHFLKNASAVALALGGLRSLQLQAQAYVQDPLYGIDKVGRLLTDPAGILNLPRHFSYRVISRTGDRMSDGLITRNQSLCALRTAKANWTVSSGAPAVRSRLSTPRRLASCQMI